MLIARSHATEACEPRQVRKEAALSNVTRVPWASLAGASAAGTARVRCFEGGCTVTKALPTLKVVEMEQFRGQAEACPPAAGRRR